MDIIKLWNDGGQADWEEALKEYYKVSSVKINIEIEEKMERVTPDEIRRQTVVEFYHFLYDEYFVWKYTAKNRLATTRNHLKKYETEGMDQLEKIRCGIFKAFDENPEDTEELLYRTQKIHGLGTAGASGLLSVLFPEYYGTIDQYVVKSLLEITNLPEYEALNEMNPESLTIKDGVILENILRRKAKGLNQKFNDKNWNPRKIDMVLWTLRVSAE